MRREHLRSDGRPLRASWVKLCCIAAVSVACLAAAPGALAATTVVPPPVPAQPNLNVNGAGATGSTTPVGPLSLQGVSPDGQLRDGACTLYGVTPQQQSGYTGDDGWRAFAKTSCGSTLTTFSMETCMAQLLADGWHTIDIYAGQDACEYTPPNPWYYLQQYSARIRLTPNRWYSTWTWMNNYVTGTAVIVQPEDTPGVQG